VGIAALTYLPETFRLRKPFGLTLCTSAWTFTMMRSCARSQDSCLAVRHHLSKDAHHYSFISSSTSTAIVIFISSILILFRYTTTWRYASKSHFKAIEHPIYYLPDVPLTGIQLFSYQKSPILLPIWYLDFVPSLRCYGLLAALPTPATQCRQQA
jgi:hypothetical protein